LYPDRPETPRLDGINRALANDCDRCSLQVLTGASSSSVRMSREYGVVSEMQCRRMAEDEQKVVKKEMSKRDFLNNLQSGMYYRNLRNGFCEQVEISSEKVQEILASDGELQGKDIKSVRIQKMSSGGFSADTKVRFTPSIPFNLRFSAGSAAGTNIVVKTMTLYHPCPLRLDGIQPDAVLSLNDPSFDDPSYVVLIPLVARNTQETSIGFLDKIMPEVVAVSAQDPATGQYNTKDIATGANWELSKVFGVQAGPDQSLEVTNGYYEWKGMPALERVREDRPGTITYKWKESGKPSPRYIMLDAPVACSPNGLAALTQRIPITPPMDAVHAVLYSSNPLQRGIVHKQGPPNPAACPTRESFTDLQGVTEESCDPWTTWAQTATRGYSTQQIFTLIFNVFVFIAMAVGAFLALVAVLRMYDVEYKTFSEGVGKVTAVFFKNLKQKAAAIKGAVGNLRGLASGKIPGAAAGGPGGLAAPGGLAGALTGNQGILSNAAGIAAPEDPMARLAAAKQGQLAELNSNIGRVAKTRRAAIPLDRNIVGPPSIPVPNGPLPFANLVQSANTAGLPLTAQAPPPPTAAVPAPAPVPAPAVPTPAKKWGQLAPTDYLGKRGFTARGGTLRRGRGRDDPTRTDAH
jgi:hypothetical protein